MVESRLSEISLEALLERYQQADAPAITELIQRLSPDLLRFFSLRRLPERKQKTCFKTPGCVFTRRGIPTAPARPCCLGCLPLPGTPGWTITASGGGSGSMRARRTVCRSWHLTRMRAGRNTDIRIADRRIAGKPAGSVNDAKSERAESGGSSLSDIL